MSYKISGECPVCENCILACPTKAISVEKGEIFIDPKLCNNCEGYYSEPQCTIHCPVSLPTPAAKKKGRTKRVEARPVTSTDLFSHSKKTHSFASAMVVWETCNILSQRDVELWQENENGEIVFSRPIGNGRGQMTFWLSDPFEKISTIILSTDKTKETLSSFDIRAACLHLIYAAHATALEQPWEQEFTISDLQIEQYLGLDKRKDLSKAAKLSLIKEIAQQSCSIITEIYWPTQGRVRGFVVPKGHLWHLIDIQHHFQEDEVGCKHLIGLTLKIRAGLWTKYFLNKTSFREGKAFYQYSSLPKSVLEAVMSLWQQHEGAVRILLWLLFKTRMGQEQRITVTTLMRIAYGDKKMKKAIQGPEERKRRLRTFENDLAVLDQYGLKPIFDPLTYPLEIQPLWAKLADIPDDPEAAIEFWIQDGSNDNHLTDIGPRGKWTQLLNARLLGFKLPQDWPQSPPESQKKRPSFSKNRQSTNQVPLTGQEIIEKRRTCGWSQRELAVQMGKSQSWIRDIENGRFQVSKKDQALLRALFQEKGPQKDIS